MPVSIQRAREQESDDPVLIVKMNKKLRLAFRVACMASGTTMREEVTRMVERFVNKNQQKRRAG
jgi:hypothetical protein